MNEPKIHIEAVRHAVSVLPSDHPAYGRYVIFVQQIRGGWGITDGVVWLTSYRDDWALGVSRALRILELQEALDLAALEALKVTVNGVTAAEAYRRSQLPRKGVVRLEGLDGPRERSFDIPEGWDAMTRAEQEAIWRPVKADLMEDTVSFTVTDGDGVDL